MVLSPRLKESSSTEEMDDCNDGSVPLPEILETFVFENSMLGLGVPFRYNGEVALMCFLIHRCTLLER